jgi:hypothetical protein
MGFFCRVFVGGIIFALQVTHGGDDWTWVLGDAWGKEAQAGYHTKGKS